MATWQPIQVRPPGAVLSSPPAPPTPGSFDPFYQNVTFYAVDARTPISVPMDAIDAAQYEAISISVNFAAQGGAALVMLLALLALTPSAKLRRPFAVLHITGLVICLARVAFMVSSYFSPYSSFYVWWTGQDSLVPHSWYVRTIAGHVVLFLFVVIIEVSLMHQAWTMVTLWPERIRYALTIVSGVITLSTIGFRFAAMVMYIRGIVEYLDFMDFFWLQQACVVTNALSIFWFCALFNSKLLVHLIVHRGMLPSARTLSSMEVLIMTNGVLMVVPVIFSGLEWRQFNNFEASSLTTTSVAIILPLGTLAAQRMTSKPTTTANNLVYVPNSNDTGSNGHTRHGFGKGNSSFSSPAKSSSLSTSFGSTSANQSTLVSQGERDLTATDPTPSQRVGSAAEDPIDLELRQIDSTYDEVTYKGGRLTQHNEMV
ncbi:hypothetical protein HIM_03125 [Hirsutella minnesotensis 3608]|nr:hypothetical protein HIM_03125 [Hirsutella minnesotensis 3608]